MKLTKRQREILEFMLKPPDDDYDDGALVSEHGQWWFGLERTSWRAVRPLIEAALIKIEDGQKSSFERWIVHDEARLVLADEHYEPQIHRAQRLGRPVSSDPKLDAQLAEEHAARLASAVDEDE